MSVMCWVFSILSKNLLLAFFLSPEEVCSELDKAIEVTALRRLKWMGWTIWPRTCLNTTIKILILKVLKLRPVEGSELANAVSIRASVLFRVSEAFVFNRLIDLVKNLLHRHVIRKLNLCRLLFTILNRTIISWICHAMWASIRTHRSFMFKFGLFIGSGGISLNISLRNFRILGVINSLLGMLQITSNLRN